MFNSVLVKYKIFSSLFLLASGVCRARHEFLNPPQLTFPKCLEFFYSIHQWCFLIESESEHFLWCRHAISSCNRETRKGHIFIGLLQNMCLLLGADLCWIYYCICTTDVDLIKILLLCPFSRFSYFPRFHYGYKSPIKTKDFGSCFIKLFSSNYLCSSFGGIYTEHTVIVLWRVANIATACMFVFSVISLWGMLSLMIIDDPRQGLSVNCFI